MSTYAVTFRIAAKTIGGKTYDDRYAQLVENVRIKDKGYWEETTSFFLVESELDTNSFTKRASNGLSAAEDLIVVFDPSDLSAAYFGALKHADVLGSFFRSLKKVQ